MKLNSNTSDTTTIRKGSAFASKRFVIGAASVLTAGALVGVGAQGAFADTPTPSPTASGSASTSGSADASAGLLDELGLGGHESVYAHLGGDVWVGHLNGAKAQALAKRIIKDQALFSLLPSSLQNDLTTLKDATVQQRTADAKKIVSSALAGGYGSAIQSLATQAKSAAAQGTDGVTSGDDQGGDANGIVGQVKGLLGQLTGGGLTSPALGAEGAQVAKSVTGDNQLASKLPDTLRNDLSTLASAPASAQTADVQKIASTALAGGYGSQIQTLADQIEHSVTAGE